MAVGKGSSRLAGSSYLLSVAVLLVVAVLSVSAVVSYSVATNATEHLLAVREAASQWQGILLDAETGVRGYLASGKAVFLEPYSSALMQERPQATVFKNLIVGDAAAFDQTQTADSDAQATMKHLTNLVDLARSGRRDEALRRLNTGEGKVLMDTFRRDLLAIRATESGLSGNHQTKAFTSGRRALLGTIALSLLSCAVILVAWRRERDQQHRVEALGDEARQRLQALSELAEALAATRSRAEVVRVVVDHGTRAAGADTCALYVLNEEGTTLELVGDRGVAPEVLEKVRRLGTAADDPEVFNRMKSGVSTWAENEIEYAKVFPATARTEARGPRARAFWSLPLVAEGQSLGLLGVGFYQPRRFPAAERSFVETLTKHCAQALLRANRLEREEEAQNWLATTLRSIGDAVIATDTAGHVTFMNPVAETLTGWPEAEARGRPLEDVFCIFSEQTGAPVESPVTKVLREGAVVGLANHTVLRGRGGSEIPIDDSGAPIRSAEGDMRGVVLVFRDVSQEKRARVQQDFLVKAGEALVSSIDYESVLATVARLAVPTIADWCGVNLVQAGERGTRQVAVAHVDDRKMRLARELGERYPPNPEAATGVPNVIRTGRPELYSEIPTNLIEAAARDAEHLRMIRELRLESAMIVPLRGRTSILGTISFVYADSGRRYSEDDLSFAEEFARRAALAIENALALKETEDARLREQQMRSQAELANRAKDEFLATVSHELRTPLSAILGRTVLVRRRGVPAEVDRSLAIIERNARLQTKLIDDVLDISRIISGKLMLTLGTTNVSETLTAALETVSAAANAKGIHLAVDVPDTTQNILADADRLQQVIWNLLSNAVKFTPEGGRIDVQAEQRGEEFRLTVRDTGEGIRRTMLPYLFEPFRQADASTTRRHGGLGLGLAIVQRIVVAHGGSVQAESEGEGKGSTFVVTIPVRPPVSIVGIGGSEHGPLEEDASADLPRLDHLRLLVVDDELDALELIAEVLTDHGAEVRTARSARDGLELVEAIRPTVLISDIGMPNMDGIALIRAVRALPVDKGGLTPAIALTAFARAEDRQRSLEAGYQMHFSKPVEIAQLVKGVVLLCKRPISS